MRSSPDYDFRGIGPATVSLHCTHRRPSGGKGGPIDRTQIRRTLIAAVVVLAAAVALVAYRWRTSGFQWSVFAATFVDVHVVWLLAAMPFILATYLGRALRWRVMLLPMRPEASLWRIFVATVIGFTAIVLFGRPGELVRPYLISTKEGVSFSSQIAAWMLERILDLLLVLLIFGIALSQISTSHVRPGPALTWLLRVGGYTAGAAGLACILLLVLFSRLSPAGERRFLDALGFLPPAWHTRATNFLTAFLQGMQSTRSAGFVLQLILYSFLEWGLIAASMACLFYAFPATAQFRLTDIFIFLGFVAFGSAFQIPGVGGGMQVAAVLVLTQFFKFRLEVATSMALVVWLFSFVGVVPFGLLLAFQQGVEWRKLKQLDKESPAV
ncbi:MAG: lysylphosphatidylglycerol synthase transmembrane domain-containing protein [Bryobacteraceae bacterium]